MEPVSVALITGLVVAAAEKFGQKVFEDVSSAAAQDAAGLGRRLLNRLLGSRTTSNEVAVEAATQDVLSAPEDQDAQAALRWKIRQLLEADADVRTDVQALVEASPEAMLAGGARASVVSGDGNAVMTGDNVGVQRNEGSGVFVGRDFHGDINSSRAAND